MLSDSIVNVKCFGELIDVTRLLSENVDDPASVDPAPGPGKDVPE